LNISFFSTRKSDGSGPIDYILGMKDHAGNERAEKPEVLMGDPEITKNLINSISRKEKYSSLSINFARDEIPTKEQKIEIINAFKSVFFSGLREDQFNFVAVAHDDHIHIVTPKIELTTKKRLNIKPPGKGTELLLENFQVLMNDKYGWRQIVEDPLKATLKKYEITGRDEKAKKQGQAKEKLNNIIVSHVRDKKIEDRSQLIEFLKEKQVKIVRIVDKSITIESQNGKRVRLEGPLFEKDSNYSQLIKKSDAAKRNPGTLSTDRLARAKSTVQQIYESRVKYNLETYKPRLGKRVRLSTISKNNGFAGSKKAPLKGTPLSGVGGGDNVSKFPDVINIREHIQKRVTSLQKTPSIKAKVIQFTRLGKESIKPLKYNVGSSTPVHATGGTHALKLVVGQMESDLYGLQMQYGLEKNPENAAALAKLIAAKKIEIMRMNQQILEAERRDQAKFKF
jgi:Relaxase/Mobilisation nuclease domain